MAFTRKKLSHNMYILIKNGKIINAESTIKADVLVLDNKIVQIAEDILANENTQVFDATGKYVIPGGIDPHVHMQLPTPAGTSSDDFLTGSIAALYGGTTTLLDFVTPSKGQSLITAFEKRQVEASRALTDYSFHVSPVEWNNSTEFEIAESYKKGFKSFKVYLAYKNTVGLNEHDFEKVLQTVGKTGGLVTVHCEMGDEIEKLRDKFVSEGKTTAENHCLTRPANLEAEAVKKAIHLAAKHKCPIYIVHVSSALSLKHIKEARKNSQKVFAETCPHYLLLDDSKYQGNFNKIAPFILSPPLRKEHDQFELWKALTDGVLQTVGTDHCPFNLDQKAAGINDFRKIPNGAGSVEHRLQLLYTFGVLQNRISLNKWVDITSTQAAKIFGLYPKKGIIAEDADADIVIWNPKFEKVISSKNHFHNCDLDIYEGFTVEGQAEAVIKNGDIVVKNGALKENVSYGKLLKR